MRNVITFGTENPVSIGTNVEVTYLRLA